MNDELKIKDLIEVPPVETVIRLEESKTNPEGIARSFVFTDQVASHFTVIADAILNKKGQGYFLQGDFGSGKSHFLAALATWLDSKSGAQILTHGHMGLKKVQDLAPRILPVTISLVNYRATTSLEQIIILAIDEVLTAAGCEETAAPLNQFLSYIRELLKDSYLLSQYAQLAGIKEAEVDDWMDKTPRAAFSLGIRLIRESGAEASAILFGERYETFHRVMQITGKHGYQGIFLIIDELSEFLRSKPSSPLLNEDARTLQLLGELCQTAPLWIIAALQESIEKTGDIAQSTLRKIKDRYPVKLQLSTVHIRSLVAGRLVIHKPGADDTIHEVYNEYKSQFSSFNATFDDFRRIYPIHPETIRLLDGLSDLFSQHRGIVDFVYSRIAGNSQKQITGIMENNIMELLGPDSIYDHFESRIAEFSAFNQYPRRILPHFREIIMRIMENDKDKNLALRLLKILILYTIHPTEKSPTAAKLTELAALTFFMQDPEINIRFICESILDRIAEESRFLVKEKKETQADTLYKIKVEGDPGKVLDDRLAQTLKEIAEEDTRILSEPLSELPASLNWPGALLLTQGLERTVNWLSSIRKVFVRFAWEKANRLIEQISYQVTEGKYDFALVILLDKKNRKPQTAWPGYVAVYRITIESVNTLTLKTYFALKSLQSSLNPANPADAQLIDRVADKLKGIKADALQLALETFYTGEFLYPNMEIPQGLHQLKRFDRLLELAGDTLLAVRYPRYKTIMPRHTDPSLFKYKYLLDFLILPGALTIKEAREHKVQESIEGIAFPLGLVEQKGGSYIFSPDITRHHFLTYLFGLVKSTGKTVISQLYETVRLGEYGVTEEIFYFVLAALAHAGLITLLKNERTMPLELINHQSVQTATALAPGELISKNDQHTLFEEAPFLLPADTYDSFGLRQQRDVWKNVVQHKDKFGRLISGIEKGFSQYAGFSSFNLFNQEQIETRLKGLKTITEEIKTSYPAREGLERFLSAFRGSGLKGEDLTFLSKLQKFFSSTEAEKFNFLHYYINHAEVEKACRSEENLAGKRQQIINLLKEPELSVILGEGAQPDVVFLEFKEHYIRLYSALHTKYYQSFRKQELSREARKAYMVLKRLAQVESLDRPQGLLSFFDEQERPLPACRYKVLEELIRTPVCACGFSFDTEPGDPEAEDTEMRIESLLAAYLAILQEPRIKQAVTAHAYALHDAEPGAAENLNQLARSLNNPELSPAGILNLFDDVSVARLSQALKGNITIKNRELDNLVKHLAGRRLTPLQIEALVKKWISCADVNTLIAIDDTPNQVTGNSGAALNWWPYLYGGFPQIYELSPVQQKEDITRMQKELEKRYPAENLKDTFYRMDNQALLHFILNEKFYFDAIHLALLIFTERFLKGMADWSGSDWHTPLYLEKEKGELVFQYLENLKAIKGIEGSRFPACLRLRLFYEQLYFHPLATRELQHQILALINKIATAGTSWLETLPSVIPVKMADNPVVLILDCVPADVWLTLLPVSGWTEHACNLTWYKLDTAPVTVEALTALFGITGDPMEVFDANNIHYETFTGNEAGQFQDLLSSYQAERPLVLRFSLFDAQAHAGTLRLSELADLLTTMRDTKIRKALEYCKIKNRTFILTTDHGLSFTGKGYTHGSGGVFESAIPRFTWEKK